MADLSNPPSAVPAPHALAALEACPALLTGLLSSAAPGPYLLTGQAGTGKSTLVAAVHEAALRARKRVAICAPTGRAAVQVGGSTIHRLFGFPLRLISRDDAVKSSRMKLLRHLDLLIVDEVSMVRADMLHAMDQAMRLARRENLPFGGAAVLLVGDPGQLPPVVSDPALVDFFHSGKPFPTHHFWGVPEFEDFGCRHLELQTVHRQDDHGLVSTLGRIRDGSIEQEELEAIGQRLDSVAASRLGWTVLCGGRARAEAINSERLGELPGPPFVYEAAHKGKVRAEQMPAPQTLLTKPGARVLIVRNSNDGAYVNGTAATVVRCHPQTITVALDNGTTHDLEPHTWTEYEYTFEPALGRIAVKEAGAFTQIPLIPAYALTIHRSQGMTLDRVCVDLWRPPFEHGQFYVAVSRIKTAENLAFTRRPTLTDNLVDPEAFQFHRFVQPV